MGLVNDGEFDNPAAWTLYAPAGAVSIAGGEFIVGPGWGTASAVVPLPRTPQAIVGAGYFYDIEVSAFNDGAPGINFFQIDMGGVPIYTAEKGAGRHTGTLYAAAPSELVFIFNWTGEFRLSRLQVIEYMGLQTDLITALSGMGADKVFPQAVPEDVEAPFVVYRVLNKDPLTTLDDSEPLINYTVAFECYADDYATALGLAAETQGYIEASGLTYYKGVSPGEDYVPLLDGYMEPLFFGFWHT